MQYRSIVDNRALNNGTSHCCSVARVWSALLCTEVFNLTSALFSIFTHAKNMPRLLWAKGALSVCGEFIDALSLNFEVFLQSSFLFSLFLLCLPPCLALRFCFCAAVHQVETHLQLQWKLTNSWMTSHLIPKKKKRYPVAVPPAQTKAVNFADTCTCWCHGYLVVMKN